MTFEKILVQVREQLQREGRVAYRILKRRFDLSDDDLEDLKADLVDAKQVAADEGGKVLVWVGDASVASSQFPVASSQPLAPNTQPPSAERRQLTVMFCDLVGSTALSEQLDPEEYREVVHAYHETCAGIITRYAGYTAQHLGDGLLVYFGYPVAHEDEAQRAIRSGLEIITALQHAAPSPALAGEGWGEGRLQVRIGVHTGLVVIGEIGSSEKREILAMGETPNIAARVQRLAAPDTVAISAATHRLVQGFFTLRGLGSHILKGISTAMEIYQVLGESGRQSRFEVAVGRGLTPLVGREEELALLRQRWAQAKEGAGQVVLLSGEPGIGKSRLVQELKEQVSAEGATRIEFRCSPYHQNSALYPIIEHLQRLLQFAREDSPAVKLEKLQRMLSRYRFPQADTLSLLAALLSLPHPEGAPPLTLSPQKQKQKIQEALVAWIVEEAEKAAVFCAWEDLHWADPSTLELLTLYLEQIPTTRIFTVLTFRPEFTPSWGPRSYLTPLTLSRLGRPQVEAMVEQATGGKALPAEVRLQIVAKTDGVPLFVEELTKTVVESVGAHGRAPLYSLDIPATLQDSLMARLDRLGSGKEIAQIGATLGREFSHELLHAVSSLDEVTLQRGLRQLVEVELLYQRGLPPQATYLFKHALIQDTAYQSLLKSTRQQLHQQIAHILEDRFPETKETQPELLAHHYTEAGLKEQAIRHWRRAGRRASQRSAYVEAINHLTKGLELLKILPNTPECVQQELVMQIALGIALIATKGYGAPEVGQAYTRARELCRQMGEAPQLFSVLGGLWVFYHHRTEYKTAYELAEQYLRLAQNVQNSYDLVWAHNVMGETLRVLGEPALARVHLEQGIALYDPQQHRALALRTGGNDPGMGSLFELALALWLLGYPAQALTRLHEALTLAQEVFHPHNLTFALGCAPILHQFRREGQAAQERAEAAITLANEQGFSFWAVWGTLLRGWALTEQGREEEGVAQIRQGLAAYRATGSEHQRPYWLALLAEACGKVGQVEEGLTVLTEALATANKTGERFYEAELYRLKGELLLTQEGCRLQAEGYREKAKEEGFRPQAEGSKGKTEEAEKCFLKAIKIVRKQQAKSLELRAVMSLSRLWQQQGKKEEAHRMLEEIYNWFTEGFDTKDLQEAKMLLEELGQ